MTPADYIGVRAPQFSSHPKLTEMVSLSDELTGLEFGTRRDYAIALRVMHWLTKEALHGGSSMGTNSGTGQAGVIVTEVEGDLSRSYSNSSRNTKYADLTTTAYGQELIELMDATLFGPRTRMIDPVAVSIV